MPVRGTREAVGVRVTLCATRDAADLRMGERSEGAGRGAGCGAREGCGGLCVSARGLSAPLRRRAENEVTCATCGNEVEMRGRWKGEVQS